MTQKLQVENHLFKNPLNYLEALYLLVQGLTSREVALVQTHLKNFHVRPNKINTKILDLFELLRRRKKLPETNFIAEKIFKKSKDNTFYKLCSRLKNKILDVLISEANNEKHHFDQLDFFSIRVRKKLTQFYQLQFSKGTGTLAAHHLLMEIITISQKHEFYPALVDALRASKYYKGFIKDIKAYHHVDKQIVFYEHCSQCVYKAADYYYKLIIRSEFHSTTNEKKLQLYLIKAIAELQTDQKKTKSAVVDYYLHQLQLEYYLNSDNYLSAHNICTDLLNLLKNNKSIYKETRVAFVYDNLAQCNIYLENFEQAVKNARNAQKLISEKSINFMVSKEVEFRALFYGNKNKKARTTIENVIKKYKNSIGAFRLSKLQYLYSNVLFQDGYYKQAFNLLNKNPEISKDKSGWDIALRILKIMCLIEREHLDIASQHVDSLRKHIDKYKTNEAGKRNLLILKCLILLERRGFKFNEVNLSDQINLLAGDDKKYRWSYMSPELIPFHKWLSDKINNSN